MKHLYQTMDVNQHLQSDPSLSNWTMISLAVVYCLNVDVSVIRSQSWLGMDGSDVILVNFN